MAQRQPSLVTPFWVRIATETSLSLGCLRQHLLLGVPGG
jgi:hypothetical protein